MLTRIGRLDGNPFSGAHRANQSHFLVARVTDLPEPLRKKALRLVVGVFKAGTDKPSCAHGAVTGDHLRPLVILSDVVIGFLKQFLICVQLVFEEGFAKCFLHLALACLGSLSAGEAH
ncbi:hypothetical protein D3C84_682050 [compost metagenome]